MNVKNAFLAHRVSQWFPTFFNLCPLKMKQSLLVAPYHKLWPYGEHYFSVISITGIFQIQQELKPPKKER